MSDLIVDRRFVVEDEIELRLAVRATDRTLHVVGTRNGKLAFLDHLEESNLSLLGAPSGLVRTLAEPSTDPAAFLASLDDGVYQRLVCQDPDDLGPVQRSEPVESFAVVDGEEL